MGKQYNQELSGVGEIQRKKQKQKQIKRQQEKVQKKQELLGGKTDQEKQKEEQEQKELKEAEQYFFGFSQLQKEKQQLQKESQQEPKFLVYKAQELDNKVIETRIEFKKKIKLEKNQKVPFNEHMSIVGENKIELADIEMNNDTQREVQFYNIALENVKLALINLQKEGIPLERPGDYLVQMYKGDDIMKKVKGRLIEQDLRIKHQEERELRVQTKKLSKKIKAKKEQEKSREKRQNVQAINDWKKEMKEKGEKARDLSEIMLDTKKFVSQNNNKGAESKYKDKKQQILSKYGGRNKGQDREGGQSGGNFNNKNKGGKNFSQGGNKGKGVTKKINKPFNKYQGKGNKSNKKGGSKKPNMKKRGVVFKKR